MQSGYEESTKRGLLDEKQAED